MPQGQGQVILGLAGSLSSRSFDAAGRNVAAAAFRKASLSAYAEFGITSWLTVVAAPTISDMKASGTATYVGSDASGLGARLRLFGTLDRVVSIEALAEPGAGSRLDAASAIALGGPRSYATALRLQYGDSFDIAGAPAFLDLDPGLRLRSNGWPTESFIDVTLGIKPRRDDLLLFQAAFDRAPAAGPTIPATSGIKVALSVVHDLSPALSVQLGAARTLAGRNIAAETSPFTALWYRF